jgi:hypothetical protein
MGSPTSGQLAGDTEFLSNFLRSLSSREEIERSDYVRRSLSQQEMDLNKNNETVSSQISNLRQRIVSAERARNSDFYWASVCLYVVVLGSGIAASLAGAVSGKVPPILAVAVAGALALVLLVGLAIATKSAAFRDRSYWNRFYWTIDKRKTDGSAVPVQIGINTADCCDPSSTGLVYRAYMMPDLSVIAGANAPVTQTALNAFLANPAKATKLPTNACVLPDLNGQMGVAFVGEMGVILLPSKEPRDNLILRYTGYFRAAQEGTHTFTHNGNQGPLGTYQGIYAVFFGDSDDRRDLRFKMDLKAGQKVPFDIYHVPPSGQSGTDFELSRLLKYQGPLDTTPRILGGSMVVPR